MGNIRGLFLCALLVAPLTGWAQPQQLFTHVQQFFPEPNRLGVFVNGYVVDERGFLWISSTEGLYRYDGANFKEYDTEKFGLSSPAYNQILMDKKGLLWLIRFEDNRRDWGKHKILSVELFDPVEEKKLSKPLADWLNKVAADKRLLCLSTAADHTLFIGVSGEGIYTYDGNLAHLVTADIRPDLILPVKTEKGLIWYYEDNKLSAINENGRIVHQNQTPPIKYCKLLGKRLLYLVFQTRRLIFDPEANTLDSLYQPAPGITIAADDYNTFSIDQRGQFWAVKSDYLDIFDPEKGLLVKEWPVGFPINRKTDVKIEWISPTTGWLEAGDRLSVINYRKELFSRALEGKEVRGISAVDDSLLLSVSYGGIYQVNHRHPEHAPVLIDTLRYGGLSISRFDSSTFLIGQHGSQVLFCERQKNWKIRRVPVIWGKRADQKDNFPFTDRAGNIWLGTMTGLYKYDPGQKSFLPYLFSDSLSSLNETTFLSFQETDKGIWMAAGKGMVFLDARTHSAKRSRDISGFTIDHFYIDPQGDFWLATKGGGLVFWDTRSDTTRHWTTRNGLSNDFVHAVYPDRSGFLWLPTNNGLSRFDPEKGEFIIFRQKDGLTHNEFNLTSHFQSPDGSLYFGGMNGITCFNPENPGFSNLTEDAPLVVSEILELNPRTMVAQNRINQYIQTGQITFNPGVGTMQLRVALIDFTQSGQREFGYLLEGFDQDWNYADDGIIRLNNLPYGHFTLRIKGKNEQQAWSVKQLNIPVVVLRPFYLKTWFLLLIVLAMAAGVWGLIWWRTARLRNERRLLEAEVAKRTARIEEQNEELKSMNDFKDRLFAIIGHELRGPLVSFRGISRKMAHLIKARDFDRLEKFGGIMDKSAVHIGDMLDNLLSWGILQRKQMIYRPLSFPVADPVDQALLAYKPLAEIKNIELSAAGPRDLMVFADQNAVRIILQNLVSNAVKFTNADGRVSITWQAAGDQVGICVKDTGAGIPQHKLDRLFTIDMGTEKGTAGETGAGLGLSLCKELIAANKGRIEVESTPGAGSAFCLFLPRPDSF
ncbi:MAG TPA: ATP-binding protein [Flavilitoribacter sp.]|nr:ATP-binding protein [Flavilitoribacter sp.]